MANNEKLNDSQSEKLEISGAEQKELREKLADKMERERSPENSAERIDGARNELEQHFKHEKHGNKVKQPKQTPPAAKPIPKNVAKTQKKAEYKKTLKTIQREMTPTERTFSKVIHNPVVEATSEVAGKTVARPAALLTGSLTALILTALVYSVAKYYGYTLSGSEWMMAFILGWAIGLIIDWVRVALLGKRAGPA